MSGLCLTSFVYNYNALNPKRLTIKDFACLCVVIDQGTPETVLPSAYKDFAYVRPVSQNQ